MLFLVVGGPPCQGFSTAGRRIEGDERNNPVHSYLAFVKLVQPRAILFENVRGFAMRFKGSAEAGQAHSQVVIGELRKLGYTDARGELIDMSDYGVRPSVGGEHERAGLAGDGVGGWRGGSGRGALCGLCDLHRSDLVFAAREHFPGDAADAGGGGNIKGPLAGAAVMLALPEALRFVGLPDPVAANLREILYGAMMAALMYWRPQGLAGTPLMKS